MTPSLATLIKRAREQSGYTQAELAERLGIKLWNIADIEAGRVRRPKPEILQALSSVLPVTLDSLNVAIGHQSPATAADAREQLSRIRNMRTQEDRLEALNELEEADPDLFDLLVELSGDVLVQQVQNRRQGRQSR